MKLSKEDIKRLKTADRICFDFYRKDNEEIHQIRAIKELRDEWNSEKTIEIPIGSSFSGTYENEVKSCFYMLHAPQQSRPWQTIISLLRAGDEIEVQWCKGYGDCTLLERSSITVDYLYLHIWRENGKEKRDVKYSFFVDYQLSQTDRLVAMIRTK
jgi:hypothetical protein